MLINLFQSQSHAKLITYIGQNKKVKSPLISQ